jgi:drug/metabolite transporter (DMT)-like permease
MSVIQQDGLSAEIRHLKAGKPVMPPPLVLHGAIFGGILAVSTASIFIRFAQSDAPSLVIAAFRLCFAALVPLAVAFSRNRKELAGLSFQDMLLGLLSGIFLALHFATWISSLEYTSVASSVVLVSTTPLWVALAAPLVVQESIGRSVWIGMGLALAGGILVAVGQHAAPAERTSPLWGNFLAVSGAWAAAGYLLIGRRLRRRLSLTSYIFIVYSMAALVLLMFMRVSGLTPLGYSPATYLWMIALAMVPQLLGHSTFNWALGHLPASFVSITLLGEPIGSTILAFLVLREIPSAFELTGGALILLGIVLSSRQQR